MIRAYSEQYLNDAMENLGEAFDYAANKCGQSLDAFMDLFVAGGFADRFGKGEPKIVSGLSGTELAIEVIAKAGRHKLNTTAPLNTGVAGYLRSINGIPLSHLEPFM